MIDKKSGRLLPNPTLPPYSFEKEKKKTEV